MIISLVLLLGCSDVVSEDTKLSALIADAGRDLEVVFGESVDLTVQLDEQVDAVWYFGDGESLSGSTVSHTYESPGHYVVTLELTRTDGVRATDTTQVLAYREAAPLPPVWSSTMALVDDSVWLVVPEANQLSQVSNGALTSELELCLGPRTVFEQNGVLAVACEESAELVLVDASSGSIRESVSLPVGSRPFGVVGRDGDWWVSLEGLDSLALVRAGSDVQLFPVGSSPRGVAIGADGTVWATCFRSQGTARLNRLDGAPVELAWSAGPDSDTGHRGLPNLMEQVAISPDGGLAYLGTVLQNVERGVYLDGKELTHETTLRGMLSVVELTTSRELYQKQFDDQGRVLNVALTPRGDWLFVSHPGTGTIHLLDAYTLAISGSLLDVGRGVNGLRVSLDGKTLYVHAWLDREVRAYSVDAFRDNALARWVAPTLSVEPLNDDVLRGKKLFYDSLDTRLAKDGYLACAHCHPDGRDDGQVWDMTGRGEGLRNTISLEGRAGLGMGPLHWSANFDEVQDFEFQIRQHSQGTGFIDDLTWTNVDSPLDTETTGLSQDLDALAAYLSSLTTTPSSPFKEKEGGREAFEAAGCEGCHPPPLYTDSSLETFVVHDIGTMGVGSGQRAGGSLEGIDTPTLLGVWSTGPYLHDGSVDSLEDAISLHQGVALDPDALETLAAFVRSL